MLEFDVVILGGGIFGASTALFLAGKNYNISLIEKETELFSKPSLVNRAGCMEAIIPRSFSTARMARTIENGLLLTINNFQISTIPGLSVLKTA